MLRLLSPEERLALVRIRIHTVERLSRDYARATEAVKTYNGSKKPIAFASALPRLELTVNLSYGSGGGPARTRRHATPRSASSFNIRRRARRRRSSACGLRM